MDPVRIIESTTRCELVPTADSHAHETSASTGRAPVVTGSWCLVFGDWMCIGGPWDIIIRNSLRQGG